MCCFCSLYSALRSFLNNATVLFRVRPPSPWRRQAVDDRARLFGSRETSSKRLEKVPSFLWNSGQGKRKKEKEKEKKQDADGYTLHTALRARRVHRPNEFGFSPTVATFNESFCTMPDQRVIRTAWLSLLSSLAPKTNRRTAGRSPSPSSNVPCQQVGNNAAMEGLLLRHYRALVHYDELIVVATKTTTLQHAIITKRGESWQQTG